MNSLLYSKGFQYPLDINFKNMILKAEQTM